MVLASASCTLAVLLSVVTQTLATTNISGMLVTFGAYAAGSATLLLSLAVFAAFASGLISRFLRRLLPHMHRITGAVLALSGGYLLLYAAVAITALAQRPRSAPVDEGADAVEDCCAPSAADPAIQQLRHDRSR